MKFTFFPLFLLLSTLIFTVQSVAQKQGQASIDSMLAALPAQQADTSKVRLLNNLSFTYYGVNPAEGLRYGAAGLALAEKLGWREGEADAHNKLGINYFIQSDYSRALQQQLEARRIYEEIGQQQNIPRVLISIGSIYQRQGDIAKATEYFNDALQRYTALGDKRGIASCYGSFGNIYKAQGNYNKSLEYQLKALALFEQLPYKDMLAINLVNIGSTYYEQRAYPQALAYYFRAERLANEIGYTAYAGEYLVNIGKVYLDIAADAAYKPANPPADGVMPPSAAASLGLADAYLNQALLVNGHVANMRVLNENYRLLSLTATRLGDYKRALETFIAYKEISDSLSSLEKRKTIARIESTRAVALKELDRLATVKKRNERVFFVAGVLMLSSIIVLAIRGRKRSVNS